MVFVISSEALTLYRKRIFFRRHKTIVQSGSRPIRHLTSEMQLHPSIAITFRGASFASSSVGRDLVVSSVVFSYLRCYNGSSGGVGFVFFFLCHDHSSIALST